MIKQIMHAPLYVLDQDEALRFYTEKLGFVVRTDITIEGFRWLTVAPAAQTDFQLLLASPAPPMFSEEDAAALRALVIKGSLSGGVLETDDCQRDYDELVVKGVTFLQPPAVRPYGIEAVLRDDSGNWFSLTQRTGW